MKEAEKFLMVGALNTLIDFGVLNLLLVLTSVREGIFYSLIKIVSFLCAATNSYFWNKFWVFKNNKEISWKEYGEFLSLASVAGFIDVFLSSLVVSFINPPFSFITPLIWANISAAVGSAPATLIRFFGYKKLVFKLSSNS